MRPTRRLLPVLVALVAWLLVAAPASAQTPVLYGGVDQTSIWLRVGSPTGPLARELDPGTYTIRVADTARNHNFRLNVPGLNLATDVAEVYAGYREWTVTLPPGVYVYNCDAHPGFAGSFTVGDVLSIGRVGSGSGDVVSVPAGIDCGAACATPFPRGTQIVLTAVAAPGSRFSGWTGPCSGTDTCTVTVSGGVVVGARFDSLVAPPKVLPPPPPVAIVRTRMATGGGGRAVVVTLRVRRHAHVTARLLRARKAVAAVRRHVSPGLRTVRVAVPRTAPAGAYTLKVSAKEAGSVTVSTRHVRVPR